MKPAFLPLVALVFTVNLWAQTITPPAAASSAPSAPNLETKQVQATPPAATLPFSEKTSEIVNVSKKNKKVAKSAVNVSPRFRDSIAPEKLLPVNIPRFETAPTIDGKLEDEIWKRAAVFKDFYQTSPGDNIAPSKPTVAYLAYDAENLYLAFYCTDEPDKIRATIAKRDEVFGEDNVRVHLDTYDDQRRAYVLGFNPHGIQQDGIYTENNGADYSVDIVMESKGVIVADGWTLEVRIPFKSLRYTAGAGKMWGIHLSRNIDRFNDEFDSWMPQDQNITSWLAQEGKITGLENIKTERTLEIAPSITISESGNRRRTIPRYELSASSIDSGKFVNDNLKQDIGVTVKFGITPNITLDAAYNPDFAEIEADAPVVTANQRFPIFFEERRPFFLEGSEIFQTPITVFYSRTIIDPDLATKLTGKIGKTSFGFLAASDKAPGNYSDEDRSDPNSYPFIKEFLDKNALFGIFRLKRDVGRNNNVGFFGTSRTFPRQRNFTGGFDGRFQLNPKTILTFQTVGSHSRRNFYDPNIDDSEYRTGNGAAYSLVLDYTERNRGFYLEADGRTQNYRSDAGFFRRPNTNSFFAGSRLSTEPAPKARIIRVNWRNNFSVQYDWQGRSQGVTGNSNLGFNLQRNTFLNVNAGLSYERLIEEEFGARRSAIKSGAFFGDSSERSANQPFISFNLYTAPTKRLNFNVFLGTIGNAFDFDFGGGARFPRRSPAALAGFPQLDPGTGRQFDLSVEAEYKPIDPLRVQLEYNKSTLKRNDNGLTAFDANIVTLRSTYQFTRFTFLRTRVDYNSLSSNMSGQILAGWNPNPGTAFYVGYNDNFNYNGFNPFTGQLEPRFERNSRTFFIRASYLFRKSF